MGGSGGGGAFHIGPSDIDALRERARQIADQSTFDAQINADLAERLANINSRDTEKANRHLDEALAALRDELEAVERTLFGGSVAKSTYVEGLSDTDALLILNLAEGESTPGEVLEQVRATLAGRLSTAEVESVQAGTLAVTVRYRDGSELQLLPAIQRAEHVQISSPDGTRWAAIHPRRFTRELSELNAAKGRAVIPAIKLAKAVIAAQITEEQRPSGYHVEALAIAAFRDYDGSRNPKAMLSQFFAYAAGGVLRPIKDISGQSHHLDERLGEPGSSARRQLSRELARIAETMDNAGTVAQWRRMLGDD
jgi:hypothetical protein